jgi:2-(1,2-epoxy-1,2-dihydrophenyl)acetyl-CoA isomerase
MTVVQLAVADGVARITLSAPERRNALGLEQARELASVTRRVAADDSVRAVLLDAQGPAFHVGGDLVGLAAAEDPAVTVRHWTAHLHTAVAQLVRMPRPLVTAVHGAAAGAGLSLALTGDLVIAGASARFTSAYTAAGLSPDGGLTWLLPRLVGHRRAQELVLTNRTLDAAEALAWGLVTQVVPDNELAATATAAATRLAAGPTAAYARSRALLRQSAVSTLETQLQDEVEGIAACAASGDGREGVAAFLAKRSPVFRGR